MDTSRHILNTVTIKDSLFGLTVAVSRTEWATSMEFPIEESFLTAENIHFLLHDDGNGIFDVCQKQWEEKRKERGRR